MKFILFLFELNYNIMKNLALLVRIHPPFQKIENIRRNVPVAFRERFQESRQFRPTFDLQDKVIRIIGFWCAGCMEVDFRHFQSFNPLQGARFQGSPSSRSTAFPCWDPVRVLRNNVCGTRTSPRCSSSLRELLQIAALRQVWVGGELDWNPDLLSGWNIDVTDRSSRPHRENPGRWNPSIPMWPVSYWRHRDAKWHQASSKIGRASCRERV